MADEWLDNTAGLLERPSAGAAARREELDGILGDGRLIAERTGWLLVEATRIGVTYRVGDDLIRFQPGGHVFAALRKLSTEAGSETGPDSPSPGITRVEDLTA